MRVESPININGDLSAQSGGQTKPNPVALHGASRWSNSDRQCLCVGVLAAVYFVPPIIVGISVGVALKNGIFGFMAGIGTCAIELCGGVVVRCFCDVKCEKIVQTTPPHEEQPLVAIKTKN